MPTCIHYSTTKLLTKFAGLPHCGGNDAVRVGAYDGGCNLVAHLCAGVADHEAGKRVSLGDVHKLDLG